MTFTLQKNLFDSTREFIWHARFHVFNALHTFYAFNVCWKKFSHVIGDMTQQKKLKKLFIDVSTGPKFYFKDVSECNF